MFLRCLIFLCFLLSCSSPESRRPQGGEETAMKEYGWTKLADSASFTASANLQLLNIRDTIWAFDTPGMFYSTDGKEYTRWNENNNRMPTGLTNFVFFKDRLISLTKRSMATGQEECVCYESVDFKNWTAHSTTLPIQDTYQPIYFNSKLWLYTNQDEARNTTRAWNSTDGIHWKLVADSLPFPLITSPLFTVLRKKIVLISSTSFVSDDGMHWNKLPLEPPAGLNSKSILGFNDILWLFGSRTSANDSSAVYFSKDLKTWDSIAVPWTARAKPATCIFRARVLLSGGRRHAGVGALAQDSVFQDSWELSNTKKTLN